MKVAIALGSNLGEPENNLLEAIARLKAAGLDDVRTSQFYKTAPVDCVPGTPDFVNGAVTGVWRRPLRELLPACKAIEEAMGRPRTHASDEARIIDLDIALVEGGAVDLPDVRIPHPQLRRRFFVLKPLCDIVPDWRVPPDGLSVGDLLVRLECRAREGGG